MRVSVVAASIAIGDSRQPAPVARTVRPRPGAFSCVHDSGELMTALRRRWRALARWERTEILAMVAFELAVVGVFMTMTMAVLS